MPKEAITILALNPGWRYWGIAVLRGAALREWRVKTIKETTPEEKRSKALRMASGLIGEYRPDVLALKRLHAERSSPDLRRLAEALRALAEREGLRVYQYSITDLEALFCTQERANKRRLAEVLAAEYPALYHELLREQRNRNPYHLRMFEAVALASVCFHQLDQP